MVVICCELALTLCLSNRARVPWIATQCTNHITHANKQENERTNKQTYIHTYRHVQRDTETHISQRRRHGRTDMHRHVDTQRNIIQRQRCGDGETHQAHRKDAHGPRSFGKLANDQLTLHVTCAGSHLTSCELSLSDSGCFIFLARGKPHLPTCSLQCPCSFSLACSPLELDPGKEMDVFSGLRLVGLARASC